MSDVLGQSLHFVVLVVVVGADETDRLDAALTHQDQVFVVVNIAVLEVGGFPTERCPPGRDIGPPGQTTGCGHRRPYGHSTGGSVHVVVWRPTGSPGPVRVAQQSAVFCLTESLSNLRSLCFKISNTQRT